MLPRDMVQAEADGGGQHEQRQHRVDLHQHVDPVCGAMTANAGDRGQVRAPEGRPLREQCLMADARMQPELARRIPQAEDSDVVAELCQRIGDRRRHALGARHRVQRAGEEADLAARHRAWRCGVAWRLAALGIVVMHGYQGD
ncbi:hypothetical protein D3C72_1526790 [compost metagenome]